MLHVISASPAMDRALDAIQREYGPGAYVRALKQRIREVLRAPDDPAWVARYGARARMIGDFIAEHRDAVALPRRTIDVAIHLVECWQTAERTQFEFKRHLGQPTIRLSLEILCELRLILRWMRRKGLRDAIATIGAEIIARAA